MFIMLHPSRLVTVMSCHRHVLSPRPSFRAPPPLVIVSVLHHWVIILLPWSLTHNYVPTFPTSFVNRRHTNDPHHKSRIHYFYYYLFITLWLYAYYMPKIWYQIHKRSYEPNRFPAILNTCRHLFEASANTTSSGITRIKNKKQCITLCINDTFISIQSQLYQ
jgi:hypothetical protein